MLRKARTENEEYNRENEIGMLYVHDDSCYIK